MSFINLTEIVEGLLTDPVHTSLTPCQMQISESQNIEFTY